MSTWYNYFASFFSYNTSFGRNAPTNDIPKLKSLVETKAIFTVTEKEIQTIIRSLRHIERIPKQIEDNRSPFVKELEMRFSDNPVITGA